MHDFNVFPLEIEHRRDLIVVIARMPCVDAKTVRVALEGASLTMSGVGPAGCHYHYVYPVPARVLRKGVTMHVTRDALQVDVPTEVARSA
jgi:hypothetical protein